MSMKGLMQMIRAQRRIKVEEEPQIFYASNEPNVRNRLQEDHVCPLDS